MHESLKSRKTAHGGRLFVNEGKLIPPEGNRHRVGQGVGDVLPRKIRLVHFLTFAFFGDEVGFLGLEEGKHFGRHLRLGHEVEIDLGVGVFVVVESKEEGFSTKFSQPRIWIRGEMFFSFFKPVGWQAVDLSFAQKQRGAIE